MQTHRVPCQPLVPDRLAQSLPPPASLTLTKVLHCIGCREKLRTGELLDHNHVLTKVHGRTKKGNFQTLKLGLKFSAQLNLTSALRRFFLPHFAVLSRAIRNILFQSSRQRVNTEGSCRKS
ncbi:hypothetical protein PoB_002515200 [Plakobranchus ocellatus]|uniref:Uncharacterized protein n=1 Tax=Plakobranchus ocellatus TaxID=259542 RepID=A0AAV3ZVQ1_9GAST|nr:hypothetical protein PoB_002515200 [Plakobranchus ocellatus]